MDWRATIKFTKFVVHNFVNLIKTPLKQVSLVIGDISIFSSVVSTFYIHKNWCSNALSINAISNR